MAEDGEQCSPIRITKRSRDSFASAVEILEVVGSSIHFIARPIAFLVQAFRELESPLIAGLFFSEPVNPPFVPSRICRGSCGLGESSPGCPSG